MNVYIPEHLRQSVEKILSILFPLISSNYSDISESRRTMSISIEDFFPNYFRFNPSPYVISNSEIINIIEKLDDIDCFRETLLKTKEAGMSRLHELLDRLRDYDREYIDDAKIPNIIRVLLDIGDELLEDPSDKQSFHLIDNAALIHAHVEALGFRLPIDHRLTCIEEAMSWGSALIEPSKLLLASEAAIKHARDPIIPIAEVPRFKEIWIKKVFFKIQNRTLLSHPYLSNILSFWWYCEEDKEKIKIWSEDITKIDENMFEFIKRFIFIKRIDTGDRIVAEEYIDIDILGRYINIMNFENRICTLQNSDIIPKEYEEVASIFLKQLTLWRNGKDPDDLFLQA